MAAQPEDPKKNPVEEDDDDPALKYFAVETPSDPAIKLGMRFVGTEVVKIAPGSWAADSGI